MPLSCPRCGTSNTDGAKHCRRCGLTLETAARAAPAGRPRQGLPAAVTKLESPGAFGSLLDILVRAGFLVLFLAGCFTGMSGIHHTNDTWIALATGRYILEHHEVPTTDPFSYTFYGKHFFNQNWLTHVAFFWVYERFGPAAVVIFFWLLTSTIYGMMLYACRIRARSWTAALLGAAVAAAASRHYLDIRPQISGYFLLAIFCAVLHYFCVPRPRQRWWPALLVFPILFVWSNAHGSFVFGYGLVAAFVGCWGLSHGFRLFLKKMGFTPGPGAPASLAQVIAISGATAAALVLTIAVGPYHWGNFVHPTLVGSSQVFRNVAEWHPPWEDIRSGLPVWPFWTAFYIMLGAVGVFGLLRLATPKREVAAKGRVVREPPLLTLFDLALVGMGLGMAFFARRFAPLYYICATPSVVTLLARLAYGTAPSLRRYGRVALGVAGWVGAIIVVRMTAGVTYGELVTKYLPAPQFNLLQRYTTAEQNPFDAMELLRPVKGPIDILAEWTVAGLVMFELPQSRVCMDGRSQQVYSEEHYIRFTALFDPQRQDPAQIRQFLDQPWVNGARTDAVLLRYGSYDTMPLISLLAGSDDWVPVILSPRSTLFVRRASTVLTELGALERAGRLHWPGYPSIPATRGFVLLATEPPELERALASMRTGVEADPAVGLLAYPKMQQAWQTLGRPAEGVAFFQREEQRLRTVPLPLDEKQRQRLVQLANICLQQLQRAPSGG